MVTRLLLSYKMSDWLLLPVLTVLCGQEMAARDADGQVDVVVVLPQDQLPTLLYLYCTPSLIG